MADRRNMWLLFHAHDNVVLKKYEPSKGFIVTWTYLSAQNTKPTQTEGKENHTTPLRFCPTEVLAVVEAVQGVSKIFAALTAFGYIATLEKFKPIPGSSASAHSIYVLVVFLFIPIHLFCRAGFPWRSHNGTDSVKY